MKKSKLKRPVKSKEQLLTEMAVKRKGYLKVSACWIVKNDAKRLGTSIGSVKQFVDELIVVDTGSTDNTIETARNFGAKIFQQPWADDFSAPRNLAIENATGDWILFLDSDEFIPAELAFNLRPAINIAVQQKKHAMLINLVNVDTDKHNDIIDSTYLCRIFKKLEGIHYVGRIHEELQTAEGKTPEKTIIVPKNVLSICHTGYSSSINREKAARNLKMLLAELENTAHPERIYGYIAQCYNGIEDFVNAEKYARLAIEKGSRNSTFAGSPYRILMKILSEEDTKRIDERLEVTKRAVEDFPNMPEFHAEFAECLAAKGEYSKAVSEMDKALKNFASYRGLEPTLFDQTMANFAAGRIRQWKKLIGGNA